MVCGLPDALSLMERVASLLPTSDGEKTTDMLQLVPAARRVPQLLV
jgi:hypothetical protein